MCYKIMHKLFIGAKIRSFAQIMTEPLLFYTVMLTTLAIMHVYWIFFMTKAALAMLGKDKNGYDS